MAELIPPLIPKLRAALDAFPSPAPDRPGIVLRDPMGFAEGMLVIPPLLAGGLRYFDGTHTEDELASYYVRATGDLRAGEAGRAMLRLLREQGFLDSPEFIARRDERRRAFAESKERTPAHSGSAYPEDPTELQSTLDGYAATNWIEEGLPASADSLGRLVAIAAPHVSPEGGFRSYAAAFSQLGPELADRTFVLLGTSHYGAPERFGLTRKAYATPAGALPVDQDLVDRLVRDGGSAIEMEDYCHAVEHSLEFQCVFLRHALGRAPRIVPILCGAFARALSEGRPPEDDEGVEQFFDALREMAEREGDRLVWILGVDLAHIGRRYGDPLPARADDGLMTEVRHEDLARLALLTRGEADAFLELALPDGDRLRWCGLSPLYAFARVAPEARGRVLRYEQWNIDDQSVVSFAGVEFRAPSDSPRNRPEAAPAGR